MIHRNKNSLGIRALLSSSFTNNLNMTLEQTLKHIAVKIYFQR